MIFYKFFVGDYQRDTRHLSLLEHGAYRCLLDAVYASEKPLPPEPDRIYRLVGAVTAEEQGAVNFVLAQFWQEEPDGWGNKRAAAEIAQRQAQAETNRRIARERETNRATDGDTNRATNRQTNGSTKPQPSQSQSQSQSQNQGEKSASAAQVCRRFASDGRNNTPFTPEQDDELMAIENRDSDGMHAFSRRVGKANNTCLNRRSKLRKKGL